MNDFDNNMRTKFINNDQMDYDSRIRTVYLLNLLSNIKYTENAQI